MYDITKVTSISDLCCADGGRNLVLCFKGGSMFGVRVYITDQEWGTVKGDEQLTKEFAIRKLNSN